MRNSNFKKLTVCHFKEERNKTLVLFNKYNNLNNNIKANAQFK